MHDAPAILAIKLAPLLDIIKERGINHDAFLDSVAIDQALFYSHHKKLTVSQVFRLLKTAVEVTGDEDIGLYIGERLTFLPNIVCYIMMNCLTLGDAMKKYSHYKDIFSEDDRVMLSVKDNMAILEMSSGSRLLSGFRPLSDSKLLSMYRFLHAISGKKLKLTGVRFAHHAPQTLLEYDRLFPCPVHFDMGLDALLFTKDSLNTPVAYPNKELLVMFEKQAREILDRISKDESFSRRVGVLLTKMLQGATIPSIELVARKLNMSVRKLQMLLNEEKTTYKQLFSAIRRELAIIYLNDRQISLAEISYLLGFSEPSAFHRAFKRWTGSTPGQFRNFRQKRVSDGA
jgi:AraC-like DNA-binding protein